MSARTAGKAALRRRRRHSNSRQRCRCQRQRPGPQACRQQRRRRQLPSASSQGTPPRLAPGGRSGWAVPYWQAACRALAAPPASSGGCGGRGARRATSAPGSRTGRPPPAPRRPRPPPERLGQQGEVSGVWRLRTRASRRHRGRAAAERRGVAGPAGGRCHGAKSRLCLPHAPRLRRRRLRPRRKSRWAVGDRRGRWIRGRSAAGQWRGRVGWAAGCLVLGCGRM